MRALALLLAAAVVACTDAETRERNEADEDDDGGSSSTGTGSSTSTSASGSTSSTSSSTSSSAEAATVGAGGSGGAGGAGGGGEGGAGGSFNGVFDVTVFVANTCEVTTNPATLSVPAGTEFKVNWIHLAGSSSEVDIDKIDSFNQVPLIIGFEPGTTFYDSVHPWCGIFTGTFSFRLTGCFEPTYLDVDCDG